MTFTDYWESLKVKNPGLAEPENKMALTVEEFRKSLEMAFVKGFNQGSAGKRKSKSFDDIFDDMNDIFKR